MPFINGTDELSEHAFIVTLYAYFFVFLFICCLFDSEQARTWKEAAQSESKAPPLSSPRPWLEVNYMCVIYYIIRVEQGMLEQQPPANYTDRATGACRRS
jgi:hypothetical protein